MSVESWEVSWSALTLVCPLGDLVGVCPVGDLCVQSWPVQGPAVLPAGGLHQRGQVGLRNVQSRQPDNRWLSVIDLQKSWI